MARTLYLTDMEIEALLTAIRKEVHRECAGKDPKDIPIRYLAKLFGVKDKIKPQQ